MEDKIKSIIAKLNTLSISGVKNMAIVVQCVQLLGAALNELEQGEKGEEVVDQ